MPTYLRYTSVCLASALLAAYVVLWFANPAPLERPHGVVRPPLIVEQKGEQLMLWGAWDTVAGYAEPGVNAVEIRCDRELSTCQEAYALIFHHDEGEDLTAQVFNYQVVEWTEQLLHAAGPMPDAECLTRSLLVSLPAGNATLELVPDGEGCEFEPSAALLVGDPL
jgi:hypothetical protein